MSSERQHLLSSPAMHKYHLAPPLWFAFSLIGGMIYGYNVSIAPSLPYIADSLNLSTSHQEMASASATLSDAAAMLIGGRLADSFGRRKVALLACAMTMLGAIGSAAWHSNFGAFLFWRLCTGVGNGLSILILPMYIAEGTDTATRGMAVAFYQLGVLSGTVLPYVVILLSESWLLTMLLGCLPAACIATSFLTGLFKESQAWRGYKNDLAATTALEARLDADDATPLTPDVGSPHSVRELWIGILLAYSNNSIDASLFTGRKLFVVAMVFLVTKYSRRQIYLVTHTVVVVAFLACFVLFEFVPAIDTPHSAASNVLILALAMLVVFQTCGPGLLFVLIVSEMFGHGAVRARYMSYCTFAMSAFSLLINGTMLSLFEGIGVGATFGGYGLTYAICLVVFYKWLPETKTRGIMEHP
ncbi:hypothetical protein SPRG_04743 [Saprolegnia parasitica CBS 223.65]|uniref:Major facilitator superfamily (MFS) profile domain-containing protein n=1 Tax=Saprolegnia parasitica (strain CBS 223.65) TaxID=695850 RepID=A0A067CVL5_SAPPC|nr:hypothetical protein SPRG_04743 [Saprolegnia parasitica CBS 223.65]KDO30842.1 hypothetical protein SPRG_04743 [Saprolegnia parasitica CBS 223.65]|eukprot:XP_012198539.1 hypothetical protein SPRG_04743 [Saprolegnia parasitica CBS 223.65]